MQVRVVFGVLLAIVAMALSGCGGSSSGTAVAPLADATAYFMQDGDGTWRQIEDPGATFVPSVTDPQGRYAFAIASIYGSRNAVGLGVICTTTSETPSIDISSAKAKLNAEEAVVISGTVSGLTVPELAKVAAGSDYSTSSGTYTLDDGLAPGSCDVAAVKYLNTTYPLEMILKSDVSVSAGTNTCNFDFANAAEVQSLGAPQNVTISNGTTGNAMVFFVTQGGTQVPVGWHQQGDTPASTFQYAPLSRTLTAGESYLADLFSRTGTETAWLLQSFDTAADQTFALPALFSTGDVTMLSESGALRASATGLTYAQALGYSLQYRAQSTSGTDYNTVAYVTPGWLGSETSFSIPDLSAITGWQTRWSVPSDATIRSWTLAAQGGSSGVSVNALIDWFLSGTPNLQPGQYITSAAKLDSY